MKKILLVLVLSTFFGNAYSQNIGEDSLFLLDFARKNIDKDESLVVTIGEIKAKSFGVTNNINQPWDISGEILFDSSSVYSMRAYELFTHQEICKGEKGWYKRSRYFEGENLFWVEEGSSIEPDNMTLALFLAPYDSSEKIIIVPRGTIQKDMVNVIRNSQTSESFVIDELKKVLSFYGINMDSVKNNTGKDYTGKLEKNGRDYKVSVKNTGAKIVVEGDIYKKDERIHVLKLDLVGDSVGRCVLYNHSNKLYFDDISWMNEMTRTFYGEEWTIHSYDPIRHSFEDEIVKVDSTREIYQSYPRSVAKFTIMRSGIRAMLPYESSLEMIPDWSKIEVADYLLDYCTTNNLPIEEDIGSWEHKGPCIYIRIVNGEVENVRIQPDSKDGVEEVLQYYSGDNTWILTQATESGNKKAVSVNSSKNEMNSSDFIFFIKAMLPKMLQEAMCY